jgi:integrase
MSKGQRPPTSDQKPRGTVQKFKDARGRAYWPARITDPDGERVWIEGRFASRARAEEKSREAEKRDVTVAKMAPTPKASGDEESCDQWHDRYLAYCKQRGVGTTGDKKYRWGKRISARLQDRTMAQVMRDEIEGVRDDLDAAILDGRIAPKTAQNAWGELTVSFGEACSSKRKDLKVRDDNPTNGVQPPETGVGRAKCYPYPSEFLAIASCDDVPLEWREIHTIAAYTYVRPGELWVLDWTDVDLDDEKIHITKAWDFKNKRIKSTKTHETRDVPIHPNLLPLLKRMHTRAGGIGLVVPALAATNPDEMAEVTRKHFELANCKRPSFQEHQDRTSRRLPLMARCRMHVGDRREREGRRSRSKASGPQAHRHDAALRRRGREPRGDVRNAVSQAAELLARIV